MILSLYDEYDKYHSQYISAIYRLLNANPDIENMIYPLSNLIHQLIENEIKIYIVEPHVSGKTYKDFKIENTHNFKLLLDNQELKKYYDEIEMCKRCFDEYKKVVLYFHKILGDYTFENSRYPINKDENTVTNKIEVDYDLLYQKWTDYCILSQKISIIYSAYCSSNTVLKLKSEKKIPNVEQENKIIDEIVNNSFEGIDEKLIDNEKEELYYFIKLFVQRNKYYDEKYVC